MVGSTSDKYEAYICITSDMLETFKPTRGHAIVKREHETETESGIILVRPDSNEQRFRQTRARVIKLGLPAIDEKKGHEIPWSIKPGDLVILNKFAGHDVMVDLDDSYNIVTEPDILLIVDEIDE